MMWHQSRQAAPCLAPWMPPADFGTYPSILKVQDWQLSSPHCGDNYMFTWVPCWISSAMDICQRKMAELLTGLKGTKVIVDYIIIHGLRAKQNTITTWSKSHWRSVDLGKGKVQIYTRRTDIFWRLGQQSRGTTTSRQGHGNDRDASSTECHKLCALLGLMNLVGKFIPHLWTVLNQWVTPWRKKHHGCGGHSRTKHSAKQNNVSVKCQN